jgi:hypothetical protein
MTRRNKEQQKSLEFIALELEEERWGVDHWIANNKKA